LARLDFNDLVEAIVVNGWSNYVEKSTGQVKRAYCSSLFATKTQLQTINLSAADPLAAFSALKGVAARSLELTPIAPILRLNTEDKRFVDAKDVLANMAQGENLAAMDWEDFEHLCRELFEKAFAGSGAEVKVTQASRDQGVDAVIFDPDVLRGGKIVVQAKRYTNTVDVSAVRDLYGAIINEGATKGILVTTSHYGPDAYGFAKDKPITLLNGEELLGLLQKYGYSFKIDLAEAKRLNAEMLK
jgi:restriction system protein